MKGNDIYMSDTEKITLQKLKNTYKQGVFIPEIQRDYVMGAGGKLSDRQDKLEKLLDAILASCKEHKDFDFSCIITYCEDALGTTLMAGQPQGPQEDPARNHCPQKTTQLQLQELIKFIPPQSFRTLICGLGESGCHL